MFYVICTKQAEEGSWEVGSCQNGLKLLRFLPSPGEGTVMGLVWGQGSDPLAWDQPVVVSEEVPGFGSIQPGGSG